MIRRVLLPLLIGLVVAAGAGCVRVPESGPVVETRSQGDVATEQGIYIDPRPPEAGATRADIARGFLVAMTATPMQTATAKEFLTEDAAAAWKPRETITYAESPTPRETPGGVRLTLGPANRLDARGAWRGPVPKSRRTIDLPMSLEDGEWRIDRAPDALIVPESWFEQRFRQESLYFFDPTATILVPEQVYVPRGEQLASSLVRALLMGPGPRLDGVSQTFIPTGLDLGLSVPVSPDGIADIPLKGDTGELTPKGIELMMAQLAWTLRQEPEIEGLRVSLNGQPLPLPGGVSSYRIDGGAEFDPAGFQASPLLYALRRGLLVSGNGGALSPVDGPLGTRARGVRSVAADLDGTTAAAVSEDGRSVLVGPVSKSDRGHLHVAGTGRDFLRPAWDFADRVWLLDRSAGTARVSYVERGRLQTLRVPGITGERVRRFLVSRDGSRLVAVVRRHRTDEVVVSRVAHRGNGRVLRATRAASIPVGGSAVPIRGIAWSTSSRVAVLNPFTPTLSHVRTASVDGSPVGADSAATTVDDRLHGLVGSPDPEEPLYGVARASLIDLGRPGRVIELGRAVTSVGYAG